MVVQALCRVCTVLLGVSLMVACSPNWEELHKIADKQLEASREYNEAVSQVTRPPSGNAGENAWLAYETRMATFQAGIDEARPTLFAETLSYVRYKDQQNYQWASLALNNAPLNFLLQRILGGGGTSGGNKVVFKGGNRTSKGGDGEGGASAGGDTSFSDIYVTLDRANFRQGDGHSAQGKDSQFQFGDGIQGQAFSRPTNQPQPSTEGGNLNNNSEGLSAEGEL